MLSEGEILHLYSVIKTCQQVKGLSEFKDFISTKIRQVFPHEIAACCISEMPHHRVVRLINVDFPAGYLRKIIRHDQVIQSPITIWTGQQAPLFINVNDANISVDPAWLRTAQERV